MYHAFIKNKIRGVFKNLSDGNFEVLLKDFSPHFIHTFAGKHALGGQRTNIEAMRQWFGRLKFLFPNLQFEIKNIVVQGGPWDTFIAIEWIDRAVLMDAKPYQNEGIHLIRLRWGRLVELHAYLDTQKAADALQYLASLGVKEAAAAPIE